MFVSHRLKKWKFHLELFYLEIQCCRLRNIFFPDFSSVFVHGIVDIAVKFDAGVDIVSDFVIVFVD